MLCLNFWGSYLFFLISFAWDTFPHQLLQIASASPLGAVLPGLHALINYEPPALERFPRTSVAPVKTVASGVLLFQRSHENYYFCFADNKEQETALVHMVLALVSSFSILALDVCHSPDLDFLLWVMLYCQWAMLNVEPELWQTSAKLVFFSKLSH